MSYKPETLLVTGGAGFIGVNFVYRWLHNHPSSRVVVLDASLFQSINESESRKVIASVKADKITRELGYVPLETFQTGIRKTIQWYLDNEQCWREVMDGTYQKWVDKRYG